MRFWLLSDDKFNLQSLYVNMKTKLLFLMLCLFSLVGCEKGQEQLNDERPNEEQPNDEKPNDEQPNGETEKLLTLLTEKSMSFDAKGAVDCKILFELKGVDADAVPEVTCNALWIDEMHSGKTIVMFNVLPNSTTEERNTEITVSYEDMSFSVDITQSGLQIDVEHRAQVLNGEYCVPNTGCISSRNGNYFAILSMNGTTGFAHLYIDQYYRFDFYSDVKPANDRTPSIPHGTYRLDPDNTGDAWTFSHSYSTRLEPKEDGSYVENYFTDGVVVVKNNSIDALLTLDNGEIHHVVYNGNLELTYMVIENNGPYSWLEEDYNFNHSGGIIRLLYYGDYTEGSNWVVQVMECQNPINGDYFSIDLMAPATGFVADYVCGSYTKATDNPYQGSTYTEAQYAVIEDDYVNPRAGAPIVSGTITIERDGLDFVLTFDCVDDLGYKITGTFRCGQLEMYDKSSGCA